MAEKENIIIGIDPGTSIMGYGIIATKGNNISIVDIGILDLTKVSDHYLKLKKIFEQTISLIDEFNPDELAIEAPFFGKNVQSMLKLGRAQGAAIAAALQRTVPIFEYAPRKIKMSITGSGNSSKEQVAGILQNLLKIDDMPKKLDATDGLAVAVCHHFQNKTLIKGKAKDWKTFIRQNPDRIK